MFFQGFNGSLRHAAYTKSNSLWASKVDYILVSDAPRNLTPLAAIANERSSNTQSEDQLGALHLFYINTNNSVTAITYNGSGEIAQISMNESFTVAQDTRSLSVVPVGQSVGNTNLEVVMFLDAPNSNITAMRGYYIASDPTPWTWKNVSDAVYNVVNQTGTRMSAPFSAATSVNSDGSHVVAIFFADARAITNTTLPPGFLVEFGNWQGLSKMLCNLHSQRT